MESKEKFKRYVDLILGALEQAGEDEDVECQAWALALSLHLSTTCQERSDPIVFFDDMVAFTRQQLLIRMQEAEPS